MTPPKDWPPVPVDIDAVLAVLRAVELPVFLGEPVRLRESFVRDIGELLEQLRVRSAALDVASEALILVLAGARPVAVDARVLLLQQAHRDLWARVRS